MFGDFRDLSTLEVSSIPLRLNKTLLLQCLLVLISNQCGAMTERLGIILRMYC